jgi:hypothetical protein
MLVFPGLVVASVLIHQLLFFKRINSALQLIKLEELIFSLLKNTPHGLGLLLAAVEPRVAEPGTSHRKAGNYRKGSATSVGKTPAYRS